MQANDLKKKNEKNILKRLSLVSSSRKIQYILDAGCGDGELSKKIKKITNAQVYGVDISPNKCKLAEQKGIIIKEADLNKKIPFKDNFFDMVFASEVIEHLVNPDNFLKEARRVLKDKGILILTTPNLASWYNRILLFLGIQPWHMEVSTQDATIGFGFLKKIKNPKPVGHLRLFTLKAIKDLLEFHSFKVDKIKGCSVNYFLFPLYFIDRIISFFPSFSSKIIVRAVKQKGVNFRNKKNAN